MQPTESMKLSLVVAKMPADLFMLLSKLRQGAESCNGVKLNNAVILQAVAEDKVISITPLCLLHHVRNYFIAIAQSSTDQTNKKAPKKRCANNTNAKNPR